MNSHPSYPFLPVECSCINEGQDFSCPFHMAPGFPFVSPSLSFSTLTHRPAFDEWPGFHYSGQAVNSGSNQQKAEEPAGSPGSAQTDAHDPQFHGCCDNADFTHQLFGNFPGDWDSHFGFSSPELDSGLDDFQGADHSSHASSFQAAPYETQLLSQPQPQQQQLHKLESPEEGSVETRTANTPVSLPVLFLKATAKPPTATCGPADDVPILPGTHFQSETGSHCDTQSQSSGQMTQFANRVGKKRGPYRKKQRPPCEGCGTTESPQWRGAKYHRHFCNACGQKLLKPLV